ncbi:MAG: ROK family transcriptional regulator [Propionibacteriaceae bacterium]|nr:ROK family transcriptional regulator [Propionibacteriaceae bacterium]
MSAPLSGTVMRSTNERHVLATLRDHEPISRADLADRLGLTRAAITRIVADLIERGYISESGLNLGRPGRPSTRLELSRDWMGIGFDSRANRTEVVALEMGGRLLHREFLELPDAIPATDYVELLASCVQRIRTSLPHTLAGVGVALPGRLSEDRTIVEKTHFFPWDNFPLERELSQALNDLPVGLRNNAECAAIANARQPELAGRSRLLHIQVGIGLGMALTRNQDLDETLPVGWGGAGHVQLGDMARQCVCGRYGCIDTVVGFPAFSRRAVAQGIPVPDGPDAMDEMAALIAERARAGEMWAVDSIDELRVALTRVLSLFITIEVPDALTLGGYVLALGDDFMDRLSESVAYQLRSPSPIIRTTIEDHAAGLGAAMVGLNQIMTLR